MAFGAEVTVEIEEMFRRLEVPGFFKSSSKGFFVVRTKHDKDEKRQENEYRAWRKVVPGVKKRILDTKKRYRLKNKEAIKLKKAKYYKENADRIKLKSKEYREKYETQ